MDWVLGQDVTSISSYIFIPNFDKSIQRIEIGIELHI